MADAPLGPGWIPPPGLDEVYLLGPEPPAVPRPAYLSGCLAVRALADGRLLGLMPLVFGSRLGVGTAARLSEPAGAWDDVWDYETAMAGLVGLAAWQPDQGQPEPSGWIRHPRTMRRRPHGDPSAEEVRP